jgi:hypothetical protein
VSEPVLISSSDPADVLGSDDGRPPGSRRVVALSTALITFVVLAVGGWWAGSAWEEHRTTARETHRASVSFALLEGSFVPNPSVPEEQEAAWSAILVNTSQGSVRIDGATWGGQPLDKAAHLSLAPHESTIVSFPSLFDCSTTVETTTLPLPVVTLDLRAPDGTVSEVKVPVLNHGVWDSTVFDACSQLTASVTNEVFLTGDPVTQLVGRVLILRFEIANQGQVRSRTPTGVTFVADGFTSTVRPAEVSDLAPGGQVAVVVRVTVSDCTLARTGDVEGIVLEPNGGSGADTGLIRALDGLVAASCPARPPA